MNNKGVTLVELLIVIVVMGIVASFSVVGVDAIISNFRQGAFVENANTIIASSENAFLMDDEIWDDGVTTLRELVDKEYVKISKDPWGGEYDLDESYVTIEEVVVSNDMFLSNINMMRTETVFKGRIVSENATIGYTEALSTFDKDDIYMLDNSKETIINRVKESITGGVWGSVLKDNEHDEIDTDNSMFGNSLIDTAGGHDNVNVGGSLWGNSNLVTGDGNDNIYIKGEIMTGGGVNTGSGNDTIKVDHTIKGNSKVETGEGDDTVDASDIYGNGSIDTGTGNDTINIDRDIMTGGEVVTGEGDDTVNAGSTIKGNTTVDTGAGNDTVNAANIFGSGKVVTGEGNDNVTVPGTMDSNASIDTGTGADNVDINRWISYGTVDTGSGNDVVTITTFGGHGTVNGGSGTDTLNLSNYTISDWNNWLSDNFSGFETVNLKDGVVNP